MPIDSDIPLRSTGDCLHPSWPRGTPAGAITLHPAPIVFPANLSPIDSDIPLQCGCLLSPMQDADGLWSQPYCPTPHARLRLIALFAPHLQPSLSSGEPTSWSWRGRHPQSREFLRSDNNASKAAPAG